MSLLGGGVQQPTGPQSRFVEGLLGGGVEQPTGPQCRFLQQGRNKEESWGNGCCKGGGHNNARGHSLGL